MVVSIQEVGRMTYIMEKVSSKIRKETPTLELLKRERKKETLKLFYQKEILSKEVTRLITLLMEMLQSVTQMETSTKVSLQIKIPEKKSYNNL